MADLKLIITSPNARLNPLLLVEKTGSSMEMKSVRAGAILYSLIETCKYHQVDDFSWFKYAAYPHSTGSYPRENGGAATL
ncbi:hypothetical protein LEG80045_20320 [Legionella pneumophila]|nr:hypothetical protein LEG80045_20320 [Legionella pneumophila]VEB30945.1 Uncharacterised protein [Legionella pneumophila]